MIILINSNNEIYAFNPDELSEVIITNNVSPVVTLFYKNNSRRQLTEEDATNFIQWFANSHGLGNEIEEEMEEN